VPEQRSPRYELLDVLSRAGSTEIARGIDRQHGREVVLRVRHLADATEREAALAEGRALLSLRPHPVLPTVRDDFFLDDRTYVVVMDAVDGASLRLFVEERGDPGLPLGTVLIGLEAVAGAIDHLHRHDPEIVHGDVRPENVLIGEGGRISLLFGTPVESTSDGANPYAAPEQATGTPRRAADVYGLAASTCFALTGAPPAAGTAIDWTGVSPEIAKRLDRVIRRALDPDPSRRPPSAPDFMERLAAARETTVPAGVVTFVLTDVEGSTDLWETHPDAMVGVMMRHYELAADIAEAHDGRMPRSQGEGDSTLTAYSRASDAIDAVLHFQRAIRDEPWPDGIELRIRAGLHTGEAQVEHGDYFGATLSRAARVRGLARGGQTFCSQATAELVTDQLPDGVTLTDLGRVTLKGLQRAEEVYELRAEDLADLAPAASLPTSEPARARLPFPTTLVTDSAFVDRREPIMAVTAQWDATSDDWHRRLVLVDGDPGIGKSRFAAEFAQQCYEAGATVLHGRCFEGSVAPYQPFVEVLEHIVRHSAPGEVRSDIVASGTLLTRLVPDIATRFPDLPDPVRGEPNTERYLVLDAVNTMLSGVAKRTPLLLVLDDLHWADQPTVAMLSHLARSPDAAPLMVLATWRAHEVARDAPIAHALADLRRDPGVVELNLDGLDEAGVAELIAGCAPAARDDFVRSVSRATAGNPLFVREICSHVGETGSKPSSFTLETLGVPEGVKEVIGRRVARLPEGGERLLTVAAVIGRDFDIDVLVAVTDVAEDEALDLLDHACAARIVEEVHGHVGRYSFVHTLTRETLYDSVGATRRARLHRRVAEALEQQFADDLDEHFGSLAYHYGQAGSELTKAVEYAWRAGDQALARFAHEEAAGHFERGLELASEPDRERCDLLLGLAEARRRAGDVPGSQKAFADAGALARELHDAERLARAAIGNFRGHTLASPSWHEPTIVLLEDALGALPPEDSSLRARVLAALSLELYFTDKRQRGIPVGAEAVAMARRLADDDALAFALACAHTSISYPDHLDERLAVSAELVAVCERLGNQELALVGHVHRASDLLESMQVEEARDEAARARSIVELLGQPMQRYFVVWLESTLALLDARFTEAAQLADEALEIATRSDHPDALVVWGTQSLVLAWQRGDTVALVEPARRLLADFPDLASWPAAVALVEATAGHLEHARHRLEAFAADPDSLEFGATWMGAAMALIEVARILDDPAAAGTFARLLEPYADRLAVVSLTVAEIGPVRRALGVAATLNGDFAAAEHHLELALATAESILAPAHVARTRVDLARMLLARGREGDAATAYELLDETRVLADILKMSGLLADIRALQADAPSAR
jgi:class 3 adenylate cyclase